MMSFQQGLIFVMQEMLSPTTGAKFAEDMSHITNNDFFIKMLKVYEISDLKNELLPKWFY